MRNVVIIMAWAMAHLASGQQLSFRHITVHHGLPKNQVNCIFQDSLGYIWFGTTGGAARFDGDALEVFDRHNGLLHQQVYTIDQVHPNEVLIGTDHGLNAIANTGVIRTFPLLHNEVRAICSSKALSASVIGTKEGLFTFANDTLLPLKTGTVVDQAMVRTLYQDIDGTLWIGTDHHGLFRYSASSSAFLQVDTLQFSPKHIRDIGQDAEGTIWIATAGNGIYTFKNEQFAPYTANGQLEDRFISSLLLTEKGNYFGTWGNGAIRVFNDEVTYYHQHNGLKDDVVLSLFQDGESDVWLGTLSTGAKMELNKLFQNYTLSDGLPDMNVRQVFYDSQQRLWITTLQGVSRYTGNGFKNYHDERSSFTRMGPIAEMSNGDIVVGGYDGSLTFIDRRDRMRKVAAPYTTEFLSMIYTAEQRLLIGTRSGWVLEYANGTFSQLHHVGTAVLCMSESPTGDVWLGTNKGVYIHGKDGSFRFFREDNPNIADDIISDIRFKDDYAFLATESNGLWRYHLINDQFNFINESNGLSSNQIESFIWVNDSVMVLASLHGIDKVLFRDSLRLPHVTSYHSPLGLAMFEFSAGCMVGDSAGLWIGTSNNGLIRFSQLSEDQTQELPRIYINQVQLFFGSVDIAPYSEQVNTHTGVVSMLQLPHDQNHLQFHFSGIHFRNFGDLEYQFKMEGFDTEWSPVTKGNHALYANLPPGEYRFRVRGSINGLDFIEADPIQVKVSQPLWLSYWTYLWAAFFVLILILVLLYRSRKQTERLARMVMQKTTQLRESEKKYKNIIESSVDVIYQTNFTGQFIYVNDLAEKLTEYSKDEFFQLNFRDLVAPQHLQAVEKFYVENWQNANALNDYLEFEIVCKSGKRKWVGQKVNVIFEPDNPTRVAFFQSIVRDISDKKRAEEERERLLLDLQQKEDTLRKITETQSTVFWLTDWETGAIDYLSPSYEQVFDRSIVEVMEHPHTWSKPLHPDDRDRVIKAFEENVPKGSYDVEFRVIKKNGDVVWVRERAFAVESVNGVIGKVSGISEDITLRKLAEDEMEQLSLVASKTMSYVIIANADDRIEWVNDAFTSMTGYTLQEAVGQRPSILLRNEEVMIPVQQEILEITARGESYRGEICNLAKDGRKIWFLLNVTPIMRDGKVHKYIAIGSDITESKLDQERIKLSERRFRELFEQTSDLVQSVNTKGHFEYVNPAWKKALGYTDEEIARLTFYDILSPDMQEKCDVLFAQVMSQPEKVFRTEVTFYSKSKKPIYLEGNIVSSSSEGEIKTRAIFHDITERKELLETLSQSEQNFRMLAESMDDVFWLADTTKRKTVYVNQAYEKLFEVPPQTLLEDATTWSNFIVDEDRERVEGAFRKRKGDQIFDEQYRVRTPSGKLKWVNAKAFPIKNELGEIVRISGITSDITPQKEHEQRTKKLKDYFEFLHYIGSSLLHIESEISLMKTVMTGIKSVFEQVQRVGFTYFNHAQDSVSYVHFDNIDHHSFEEVRSKPSQGPLSSFSGLGVLQQGRYYYQPDLRQATLSQVDRDNVAQGVLSYILLPLMDEHELYGAIAVGFSEADTLTELEINMFNELTLLVSTKLLQNRLVNEIKLNNKEINNSLLYARRIQKTILPSASMLSGFFADHFVLYKPKEKVSGDFYYFKHHPLNTEEAIFGVIDCTGHGVPGALVSLIGHNALSRAIWQQMVDPGEILTFLNREIMHAMILEGEDPLHDSMDLVLCRYNKATKILHYSGVINSLYLLRGGEVQELKTSLHDMGASTDTAYTSEELQLQAGDQLIMATDGYQDQFGGPDNRRMMKKRLKTVLEQCNGRSGKEQYNLLEAYFQEWKGNGDQIDDVTILGVMV